MSDGLNQILLVGQLGRDPQLRAATEAEPEPTASCSIAVSTYDRATRAEVTEWVPCMMRGPTAEAAARLLRKGSRVFVEGHWHVHEGKTRSGEPKKTPVCMVSRFLLHEPRPPRTADPSAEPGPARATASRAVPPRPTFPKAAAPRVLFDDAAEDAAEPPKLDPVFAEDDDIPF